MKPGYKSSEAGLMLAGIVTTALNKKLGLDIEPDVLLALFGALSVYAAQRGWVKAKAAA
jgi:hypothetical protein